MKITARSVALSPVVSAQPWRLPPCVRGARAAAIFLTRVPLGGFPFRSEDWRWAPAYFPFVGFFLGLTMAALYWVMQPAGPLPAAAFCLAGGMMLTGAFHEDGLADTADALGGAFDRKKLFLILKDSRLGSFGTAALAMALLLRASLLARLDDAAPLALVITQCVARMPPIWLMGALPYVTDDAEARSKLVARAQWPQLLLASFWPLALLTWTVRAGYLPLYLALFLFATCTAVAVVCGWRFAVRAGGLTGDFLGATEQVTECALLLVWAWLRAMP